MAPSVIDDQRIDQTLKQWAEEFEPRFAECLRPTGDVPARLVEAVRYTALSRGKRIRSFLTQRCCELAGGTARDAWPAVAAIECIHTFSLIHDDLPAMDDDDLRRGRPANHKKFDEATAILAGDALLALAFELTASPDIPCDRAAAMTLELARGAGWCGMIGGQAADIEGQDRPPTIASVDYIHERKTASLFATACRLGALAAGADDEAVAAVGRYGRQLGRAFQIADDLLDLTSTSSRLGKNVRKDADAGKQTFPRCVGIEESRKAAQDAVDQAVAALQPFGDEAADLIALATYVVRRQH